MNNNGHWWVFREIPRYEPEWHWKMYRTASHPFPTEEAAEKFAKWSKGKFTDADIKVRWVENETLRVR